MEEERTYTAFQGVQQIAAGSLSEMLPRVKARFDRGDNTSLLIFEDQTGRQVDFDLRGMVEDAIARALPPQPRTGPGRPRLGVVSREVSLLPRHWEWLEQQPHGASATLRRLVDQARKHEPGEQAARLAMAAADRFMSVMAGNLSAYEEASRALYAADRERFEHLIEDWPGDIRDHTLRLAENAFRPDEAATR